MQFSVILGILLTLLSARQVTRNDLAEKFEIDIRTVSRYLDIISAAGVPFESVRGKGGGIRLPDTYRLERSFFTKEELLRLSKCVSAMRLSFDDNINNVLLDKINHMAKSKQDEKYLLKSDSLVIDMAAWTNPNIYRGLIETINKAISGGLQLQMVYIDRNDYYSERTVDPYTLVLKEGVWYLYGYCNLRHDFRLFKLSRMRSAVITVHPFTRRECNLNEKLYADFDDMDLLEIKIEFSNTVKGEIEEWLGFDAIMDEGYKCVAKASVYGGNMLIKKLLSFGSSVKVISPSALREELAVECRRIANNYE